MCFIISHHEKAMNVLKNPGQSSIFQPSTHTNHPTISIPVSH